MNIEQICSIVRKQTAYFATGKTLDVDFRIAGLKKPQQALRSNEAAISDWLIHRFLG